MRGDDDDDDELELDIMVLELVVKVEGLSLLPALAFHTTEDQN